jgi:hypothetical protein
MRTRLVGRLAVVGATFPLVLLAACGSNSPDAATTHETGAAAAKPATHGAATTSSTTTSTTAPPPTSSTSFPPTTTPPTTSPPSPVPTTSPAVPTPVPPLATPAEGLVAGHVTAVGDSVMLDYQAALQADIPGADVEAAVSRQWDTGEQVLQQLRSEGRLGSVVVVALGTNGPITSADFDAMMSVLAGTSRVVFVNVVVDQPWQDPNDQVLASGVARYPNTVVADWASLEAQHPDWVYSDGTHLPIGGTGAQALAALIASEA